MTSLKTTIGAVVLGGLLAASSLALAADNPGQGAQKKQKLKPYPLKTCLVTGEKLGGMGDPYVYQYKDREIKFCCKGCLKDFNKSPAKYIKKLEEAEKSQKEAKPATPQGGQQH